MTVVKMQSAVVEKITANLLADLGPVMALMRATDYRDSAGNDKDYDLWCAVHSLITFHDWEEAA